MILLMLLTMGIVWSLYDLVPVRPASPYGPDFEEYVWQLYSRFPAVAQDIPFEQFRTDYIQAIRPPTVSEAYGLVMGRMS